MFKKFKNTRLFNKPRYLICRKNKTLSKGLRKDNNRQKCPEHCEGMVNTTTGKPSSERGTSPYSNECRGRVSSRQHVEKWSVPYKHFNMKGLKGVCHTNTST